MTAGKTMLELIRLLYDAPAGHPEERRYAEPLYPMVREAMRDGYISSDAAACSAPPVLRVLARMRAEVRRLESVVQLYQALGGGWQS